MNLAVLAATLVDVVDFFPVTLLYGVSKFLFSALALAFWLSLLASFVVAMTVIPLFCSRFLKSVPHAAAPERGERCEIEPTALRAIPGAIVSMPHSTAASTACWTFTSARCGARCGGRA